MLTNGVLVCEREGSGPDDDLGVWTGVLASDALSICNEARATCSSDLLSAGGQGGSLTFSIGVRFGLSVCTLEVGEPMMLGMTGGGRLLLPLPFEGMPTVLWRCAFSSRVTSSVLARLGWGRVAAGLEG